MCIYSDFYTISEERKDEMLKDIMNKQIRIIDFAYLVSAAASLKKEREEKTDRGEQWEN